MALVKVCDISTFGSKTNKKSTNQTTTTDFAGILVLSSFNLLI